MSYWKNRQKKLYSSLEKDEEKLKKRLNKFYEKEAAKLDNEIAAFYSRYGENNIIKYRSLLEKMSPGDVKLLYEKWDAFAKKYPQYAYLMPVRENIYKLNRLEGLEYSVRMQQLEIGAVTNEELTKHLSKQAQRGANTTAEVMGFGKNFYSIDSDIVKSVVNVAWVDGKNFSERIWGNTDKLANYLKNDLAQGFARGDSYENLTKKIRERFLNVSRRDAYRLVYTEGTYVMAHSSLKPFENDFQQYKIVTAGDSKVCDVCRGIEKNVFDMKDRVSGVNFPPFHAWCRCSFEIYVADWDKWMDDYVKKHGGESRGQAETIKKGLASGNQDDSFMESKIIMREKLTITDNATKIKVLKDYEKKLVDLDTEHAIVITSEGQVIEVVGDKSRVYIDLLTDEQLEGAYVTHNHPKDETAYSFSHDDIELFIDKKLDYLRGVDYLYEYTLDRNFTGNNDDSDSLNWFDLFNYHHADSCRICNEKQIHYWRVKK